jgi:hypothetical protein
MNFLTLGAMALSLTGPTADDAQDQGDWQGLDKEIQNLASSLQGESGVNISGYTIIRWDHSSDVTPLGNPPPNDANGNPADLSGFTVQNARLAITGEVGDYGFKIQPDFSQTSNTVSGQLLQDAKVWWNFGDNFKLTVGQYKVPFSARFLVGLNQNAFLDPSLYLFNPVAVAAPVAGTSLLKPYADRDQGLMVGGSMDMFDWDISFSNGTDSVGDKYLISGRVDVHLMGGGAPTYQGGYGLGDESALTIGGGYMDDGFTTDGSAWTLDALWAMNPFTVGASIIGQGKGFSVANQTETPWDIYGTYMFTPNEWEFALKYEDVDDAVGTTAFTIGVNWYLYGPDSKWQLNYKSISRNGGTVPVPDGGIIEAGLVLSF